MKTAPAPEAFGSTIFCDDIRVEVGGKLTFVGCYTGTMFIHTGFPVVLPKFCLGITYAQERGKVIKPIKFAVLLPNDPEDKPSIEFGVSDEAFEEVLRNIESEGAEIENRAGKAFAIVRSQIGVNNLVISEPGTIKV